MTSQRKALSTYLDSSLQRLEEQIARAHARAEAEEAKIRERRDAEAAARPAEATYVTEISVPSFGDDGVQRLFQPMREPEPLPEQEPEAEAG